MAKKWIVQHLGYPTSNAIREDQWAVLSTHSSEDAAHKAVTAARAHLDCGQWDDHYRVIGPDGKISEHWAWVDRQNWKQTERDYKKFANR